MTGLVSNGKPLKGETMQGIIVIALFLWFAGKYLERPIDDIRTRRPPTKKEQIRRFCKDDDEYLDYLISMEENGHNIDNLL